MRHPTVYYGSSIFCLITHPYSPHSQPRTEPTYMDGNEIRQIYLFAIFEQNLFYKISTNVMFKYNRKNSSMKKRSLKPNVLLGYWAAKTASLNKLKDQIKILMAW